MPPRLAPTRANGRSSNGRSASSMAQSMASTSVTNGSSWRSWRPGYWIASSSTSAGRRASQPRKVPALPPAGGSAIRRRRGCALPLRCNHRARARSVAGGNGGASAAWQRRTTSRASGSPCNSPRLSCLPVSRRNSAIACTPNSECPPALAKPWSAASGRPSTRDNTLSTRRSSTLSSAWAAAGGCAGSSSNASNASR